MLTCEYGLMYLHLDDYPPYYGKKSDILETHINSNLRRIHGNTTDKCCGVSTDFISKLTDFFIIIGEKD